MYKFSMEVILILTILKCQREKCYFFQQCSFLLRSIDVWFFSECSRKRMTLGKGMKVRMMKKLDWTLNTHSGQVKGI